MVKKIWDEFAIDRLVRWTLKSDRSQNKIYDDFLEVSRQTGYADPNWSTMDLFSGARGNNPMAKDMEKAISELGDGYTEIEVDCKIANPERNLALCTVRSFEDKSIYSVLNLPADGVEAVAKHAIVEMEGYMKPGSHYIKQIILDL